MTAEEFAAQWRDSPEHAELVAWLSWTLENERALDSIPCSIVPFWELTEAIESAGLKPTSTVEIFRAAGLIIPQTIMPAKAPEEPETITPAHPHQLRPDGWLISGDVLYVQKRWTTAQGDTGADEFVSFEQLRVHAGWSSESSCYRAVRGQDVQRKPDGRTWLYRYADVLPFLRAKTRPDWPDSAASLKLETRKSAPIKRCLR